jgi:hypothetical protein
MDAHRQMGSIPIYSTKMFFETIYVILSTRLVVWMGVETDDFKVSRKPYYPRAAGSR